MALPNFITRVFSDYSIPRIKESVMAYITATGSTTERSLPARFSDVLNIKDFGAKGDGTTDDTAAFAAVMTKVAALYAESVTPTILVPYGDYKITDTWSITYPCNVLCKGNIKYTGSLDKPCVAIGGASGRGSSVMASLNFEFGNVTNSTSGYSSDSFVGIRFKNICKSHLKFGEILGFSRGVEVAADNDGCHFNVITGSLIRYCLKDFVVKSSTGGWPNGNKFSDAFLHGPETAWTTGDYYSIYFETDGTYGANSWIFDNLKFENGSTANYTPIYINSYTKKVLINDYRAEFTGSEGDNIASRFCTVDFYIQRSSGDYVSRDIVLKSNQATGGMGIKYHRVNQGPGAQNTSYFQMELYSACRFDNAILYTLFSLNFDEIQNELLNIGTGSYILRNFRNITWYCSGEGTLDSVQGVDKSNIGNQTRSDGIKNFTFVIEVNEPNSTFWIKTSSLTRLNLKCYDSSKSVIDTRTDLGKSSGTPEYLTGPLYITRPYYPDDVAKFSISYPNNFTNFPFSVVSSSVKYVIVMFVADAIKGLWVTSTSEKNRVIKSLSADNKFWSTTAPTAYDSYAKIGEKVYKAGSATNEYWELTKGTDNTLSWVAH